MKLNLKNTALSIIILFVFSSLSIIFIDKPLYNFFSEAKQNFPSVTVFLTSLTDFGEVSYLFVLAVLLIAIEKIYSKAEFKGKFISAEFSYVSFIYLNCLVFSTCLTYYLKVIVGRARPVIGDPWQFEPFSLMHDFNSLPSGHTQAICALLVFLLALRSNNFLMKAIISVVVSLVVLSRLYLGAHYLTDVVLGMSIGFIMASFFVVQFLENEKLFILFQKNKWIDLYKQGFEQVFKKDP